jgi:ornithine carbamoyltransferase
MYIYAMTKQHPISHLLTGEELSPAAIGHLLAIAADLKKERNRTKRTELAGQHLALLFDKPSLRTRFSFMVAMRELGGDVIESTENSRKTELPHDQAAVLSGYCHAIMVRTHADQIIQNMAKSSKIPIINGLSNLHHPCQILSDLLTLQETFGELKNLTLSYIGDGNNILHSLLLLAPQMGVHIHYCCPESREPDAEIVAKSLQKQTHGKIKKFATPAAAVQGAHAVYTDVWTSMGFEPQQAEHLFEGFQVNETLMAKAQPQAIFMHCLPMERGKEVSETLPDQACSVVFRQSENRLHMQKALLLFLLKE